jgi:ABC-type Mn2+/Zn2+ transport system permease subunit
MITDYIEFFGDVIAHVVLFGLLAALAMALLFFAGGFLLWLVDKSREEKTQWRNWDK